MKPAILILTGLMSLAVSGALAQTVPGSGGGAPMSAQQSSGGAIGRMTADQQASAFQSEEMRRRTNPTPEEAEEIYGAERMDLARRVQGLIDQRRCREARELANAEGDRNMALRVRQTCR